MRLRRDKEFGSSYLVGVEREVYGKKPDGTFICPLDICLYQINDDNKEEKTNAGEGAFLDDSVSSPGGGHLGNIDNYSLPVSDGILLDVNPIVEVTPTRRVKARFSRMLDITKDTVITPKINDIVWLQSFDTNPNSMTWKTGSNKGKVIELAQKFPYLNSSFRIDAFMVEFENDVKAKEIGSRVIVKGKGVVGMLITVKNASTTKCLVYPASKI